MRWPDVPKEVWQERAERARRRKRSYEGVSALRTRLGDHVEAERWWDLRDKAQADVDLCEERSAGREKR